MVRNCTSFAGAGLLRLPPQQGLLGAAARHQARDYGIAMARTPLRDQK
jgi:hypothetical protein